MNDPGAPPPHKPKSGAAPWIIGCAVVGGVGVLIAGLLAVLAIHGVRKFVVAAKNAEAQNTLREIGVDAQAAFDRESGDPLASPSSAPIHSLCLSATRSVPASIPPAAKYQSAPSDWTVDAATHAGFACLGFSMTAPQYYRYSYSSTPPGNVVGNGFEATAEGDLDGDGVTSKFVLLGKIGAGGDLLVAPTIAETNPTE